MTLWALAAACALASVAGAADTSGSLEQQGAAITGQAKALGASMMARPKPEAPAQGPQPGSSDGDDIRLIREAGLDFYTLKQTGWYDGSDPSRLRQLAVAIRRASTAARELHARYPSSTADATGSGTVTNAVETCKFVVGAGNLERGCLSHQMQTVAALGRLPGLNVKRIMLGKGIEHHAVVVFPDDQSGEQWKASGVVFDAWREQSSEPGKMVFHFPAWNSKFTFLVAPRLEE